MNTEQTSKYIFMYVVGLQKQPAVFYKKAVLKNFKISTGSTCVVFSFKKIAGLKASNFINKRRQHG